MGNRASRHQEKAFFSTRRLSLMLPRRSEENARRKSAEIKANGPEHANRVENEKYAIPPTTEGVSRLEIQHYLMRYLWQSNFESPVGSVLNKPDSRVLDFGCGDGTWCKELSEEYPNAQITGLDSDEFLPAKQEASNLKFVNYDFANKKLPFDDNTFDFVHMRFLLTDIKESDYSEFVSELVRVTKENAYIEILEFDVLHFAGGPVTRRLTNATMSLLAKKGFNGEISNNIPMFLKKSGKINEINEHDKSIALGHWAGRVGELAIEDLSSMFQSKKKELADELKIDEAEVDKIVEDYKKEVEDKRSFFKTRRFFAQKVAE
jgi:ubiquinone/menaquinone biosynthesis C-methylase UbiE